MNQSISAMNQSVAIIAGEQGAHVMETVVPVLGSVGRFDYQTAFGSPTTREHHAGLPPSADVLAEHADAILLGPVEEAETVTLRLGKVIEAHAVVQPVKAFDMLAAQSPLRNEHLEGTDLVIVHAIGDFYQGPKGWTDESAYDVGEYTPMQIQAVGRVAFDLARSRAINREQAGSAVQVPRVTSVDKANVLETSRLWRATMTTLQEIEYPDVDLQHILADNAAMEMIAHPSHHDVVVSNHIFGDLLAGEVSAITHPGLVPSATLNREGLGIYRAARPEGEGGAPSMVMAAAEALRHSLGRPEEALAVELAVEDALEAGALTPSLGGRTSDQEFVEEVVHAIGGHLSRR